MKTCHHCSREVRLTSALQRTDSCPYCLSDLKVCLNCRFFDPSAPNQCREPLVEPVPDKSKANFCEFFEWLEVSALGRPGLGGSQSEEDRARAAFDSLFKKKR
jgi:hypothetical protein